MALGLSVPDFISVLASSVDSVVILVTVIGPMVQYLRRPGK